MKWKKREVEIRRLRKQNPVLSVTAMPDLRTMPTYPSLSETGVPSTRDSTALLRPVSQATLSKRYFVGSPHKQGPMVMFHDELPWGGGKKS